MWNATVPTKGTPFPVNGCVFGCAIGNDPYTDIQHETAIAMGWSGWAGGGRQGAGKGGRSQLQRATPAGSRRKRKLAADIG